MAEMVVTRDGADSPTVVEEGVRNGQGPVVYQESPRTSVSALTTPLATLLNRRLSSKDLMRLIQLTFLSLALWVIIPLSEQLKLFLHQIDSASSDQ